MRKNSLVIITCLNLTSEAKYENVYLKDQEIVRGWKLIEAFLMISLVVVVKKLKLIWTNNLLLSINKFQCKMCLLLIALWSNERRVEIKNINF